MPTWITVILIASAIVTALGILWTKALRPGARIISTAERTVPLLQKLTETFADDPSVFDVLDEIASQFRTNAGSSLRDVVNRLETALEDAAARDKKLEADLVLATTEAKSTADVLRVNVESAKRMADADRARMSELLVLLGRVSANVETSNAAVGVIGDDISAAHDRADAHLESEPGSAADAFSKRVLAEES